MSGLEIVILVGAGILITKKVKAHREEKKLKKLAAAGLLPEQHAPAQLVDSETQRRLERRQQLRQQTQPEEEEPLPLYMPPSHDEKSSSETPDDSQNIHLPSYDETLRHGPSRRASEGTSQGEPSRQNSEDPFRDELGQHTNDDNTEELLLNDGQPLPTTFADIDPAAASSPDPRAPTTGKGRAKKWKLWKKEPITV